MSNQVIPPFPALAPSSTAEGALADLAGAVMIAVELLIDQNAPVSNMSFVLMTALRQWQDSGFARDGAQHVADKIAEALVTHGMER